MVQFETTNPFASHFLIVFAVGGTVVGKWDSVWELTGHVVFPGMFLASSKCGNRIDHMDLVSQTAGRNQFSNFAGYLPALFELIRLL